MLLKYVHVVDVVEAHATAAKKLYLMKTFVVKTSYN